MKTPTLCAWLICKNEERDLPRALKSIADIVDHVIVVDTGSTDRTEIVAMTTIDKPVTCVRYLGASAPDENGDWKLQSFAKARNYALGLARMSGCSHVFWLDADDEVKTPAAIRRALYLPPAAIGMWIELGGGLRQIHHRLWPADYNIEFRGACHEYPVLDGYKDLVLNDACIQHDATPHGSETSNARNLRMLEAEYADSPTARCAFYLANTHKDGGRWKEAAHWYHVRLGYGDAWRDEYLFAALYLARCLRFAGDPDAAQQAATYGLELALDWCEFRMELAFIAYQAARYAEAIDLATPAINRTPPLTVLWREPTMYKDQPARLISWCHEHMGNLAQALTFSRLATQLIGAPDADWQQRETVLQARVAAPRDAPAVVTPQRRRIALHRPGAIGDILMTLNLIPLLRAANPGVEVHYYCHRTLGDMDALGTTIMNAGADLVLDCATLPQRERDYERVVNLVGYPMVEGYPYKPMKRHLLEYFAAEMGVQLPAEAEAVKHRDGRIDLWQRVPALELPLPRRFDGLPERYATLQVKSGWSKYKDWPVENWARVVAALDFPVVQIGGPDEPRVPGVADRFYGVLDRSIAVFAHAALHLGIDSWPNHASNFYWIRPGRGRRVPAVILWGSTQWSAAGYPQNANFSAELQCQPCFREDAAISRQRTDPCPNDHACMKAHNVEHVIRAARELWDRTATPRRVPA